MAVVIAVPEMPAVVLAAPVMPALTRWMSTPLAKVMPTPPAALLRTFGLVAGSGLPEGGDEDRRWWGAGAGAAGVDGEPERFAEEALVGLEDDPAVVGGDRRRAVDAEEDDVAVTVEPVGGAAGGQRGE